MPKAVVVQTDGTCQVKELSTLEDYKSEVGGYVELFRLPDGRCCMVNENGKMLKLPRNSRATQYLIKRGPVSQAIVGNMIVLGELVDEQWTDVTDDVVAELCR